MPKSLCWIRTGQVGADGPMLDQVGPEGQAHLECTCMPVSREGKPRELRGGEQTHPSGSSSLAVAMHAYGREEEGPRAAVAK